MTEPRDLSRWLCAPTSSDAAVFVDGDGATDETEFRACVVAWCQALQPYAGQPVALFADDLAVFAAALFGAWHAGCSAWLPADLHAETVARLRPQVTAWIGELPPSFAALIPHPAPTVGSELPSIDPGRGELVLFTSGSSGDPQPIRKRLCQLFDEIAALEQAFGERLGAANVLATVPPQHIYGLLFRLLWPLAARRPIERNRIVYPEQLTAVADARPALLVGTPAHLSRLPDALPTVRLNAVFSSGGPLPGAAAAQCRRLFDCAVIEVYGSSETGGIAWREQVDERQAWTALPGVEWRIDGEQLVVRSRFADVGAEWCRTADRVEAAGSGFRLLGRVDRIVKIEQRRVSLDALERALQAHPAVQAARVVVLPGARDQLGAVLVCSPAHQAIERSELQAELRQQLAAVADRVCWPRRWRFVDALPVDARGKTSQAALRSLFRRARPLPLWLASADGRAEAECTLDPDLEAFAGHFPEAAVLPGVALVDWAARWGCERFSIQGEFLGMEQLKFQRIARPGMRLHLVLEHDAARGLLGFRFESSVGLHASGRLRFAPA